MDPGAGGVDDDARRRPAGAAAEEAGRGRPMPPTLRASRGVWRRPEAPRTRPVLQQKQRGAEPGVADRMRPVRVAPGVVLERADQERADEADKRRRRTRPSSTPGSSLPRRTTSRPG